jgi:ABC-type sugar transport system ATPase subunit
MTSSSPPLLQARGVSKRFGAVRALRDVTVGFHGGQVHALVGENGAGKSTLAKVVAGVHQPDGGELLHHGEPARLSSPAAALAAGISVIYQELSLIPELTVAANVFLAHEALTKRGTLDERRMRRRTDELLEQLGARFDAGALVADLSAADQQLAEIARALNHRAEIIVMDEPTASLPEDSARHLFGVVRRLRARGACVIYVSHELDHVFELADRVTVLKDGQHIVTRDVAETSREEVIRGMVGRTLGEMFPPRPAAPAGANGGAGARPPALRVEGLSLPGHFEDVSFEVRAGEIVGVAGLIGAGRTAVARAVFGAPPAVGGALALRGSVQVEGRELHPRRPRDAIAAGIAYVPEERKTDGLALDLSVVENLSLPQLAELARAGVIDRGREAALAAELEAAGRLAGTSDLVEGVTAFIEKRPPEFQGK